MYYAFNLVDAKGIDKFTVTNIDKVTLVSFTKLEELEKFTENHYTYIGVYDYREKYPTPIDFDSKIDAKLALIDCLNNAGK